jgi:septum formation topological specificity factor MinE
VSLQIQTFENLDKKVAKIKELIGLRVTIIDKSGVVIAESDKDKKTMDNHANRNEVILSKYQEYGDTIRYSKTLKKELLYVAKKYNINNETYYIRMARDLEAINDGFYDMSLKVVLLFFFLLLLSFWIALRSSYKIEAETREILEFLKTLTKQKR